MTVLYAVTYRHPDTGRPIGDMFESMVMAKLHADLVIQQYGVRAYVCPIEAPI